MIARSLLAILAAVLVLVPVQADEPAVKPVVVPFEMLSSGHMAVQVKVNGKGPYKLIFDTGAPVVLLSNRISRDARLLKGADMAPFALLGGVGEAQVKTLEVGGLKVDNLKAVVMDHPLVEAMSRRLGPIDGIVGFPFFARFKMTIDYQARKLSFVPGKYRPGDVLQSLQNALLQRMMGSPAPRLLAPAAQWGMVAAKRADDEEPGVNLREVVANSAAARAGLKAGDRLLTIDDRWTDTLEDVFTITGSIKPGTAVSVRVERDGKEVTVTVKPAAGM
jgi:membrane-associated protease RseP (regulator of RpoE activity)